MQSQAESALEHAPFSSLFGAAVVNQIGRVVARKDPLNSLRGTVDKAALEAATHEQLRRAIDLYAAGGVLPALAVLSTENNISRETLSEILSFSRLVPLGKLDILVEGYYQFFAGNLFTAAHIIVPQIEPILRHLLESNGVIVTQLKHDLVQDESTLNSLLDGNELVSILGQDVIFNLKVLLISRFGFNFRHRMAHGLMYAPEYGGGPIAYMLWLLLRLCCHHLIISYHNGLEKWERQALEERTNFIREGAYFKWEERIRSGIQGSAENDWLKAEEEFFQEPLNCS